MVPREAQGKRRRGGQPLKWVVTWCGVPVLAVLEWKPGRASCVREEAWIFPGCWGLFGAVCCVVVVVAGIVEDRKLGGEDMVGRVM